MKKVVLVMTAIALIFAGCKKEEVEPAPQPAAVTHKPIADVDMSLAKQGFTNEDVYVRIFDVDGANLYTTPASSPIYSSCGGVNPKKFNFNVDEEYTIYITTSFSTVPPVADTIFYGNVKLVAGDIWPNVDLEEVGIHSGTATSLFKKHCNTLGDQLVVVE